MKSHALKHDAEANTATIDTSRPLEPGLDEETNLPEPTLSAGSEVSDDNSALVYNSELYQTLDSLPSTSTGASTSFVNPAYLNKTAHENNVQKQNKFHDGYADKCDQYDIKFNKPADKKAHDNTSVEANTITGSKPEKESSPEILDFGSASDFLQYLSCDTSGVAE